jgi:mannose-6-phosphate isomerase
VSPVAPAPLFPVPRLVERPWGGSALRAWGRSCPDDSRIGESWELGSVPGFDSSFEGDSFPLLSQAVAYRDGMWLGTSAGGFPLLVKLIDARETLSLQVHPAHDGPGFRAKSECWVVLEASAGAFVYAGVVPGLSAGDLFDRLEAGDVSVLRRIPVSVGDVVVVPGGTVHAITAGLVLAEVQQSSDTTYRLHDWGRLGLDGVPRQLHLEEARSCVDLRPNDGLKPRPVALDAGTELLCATPWFALRRRRPGPRQVLPPGDGFRILLALEDPVELSWDGGRRTLERGRTVLVPRGLEVELVGGLVLEAWMPDWNRDILEPVLAAGHSRGDACQLSAGTVSP